MKRIKYFIPAIIWMVVIFLESAMSGDLSSEQSNFLVDILYTYLPISLDLNMLSLIVRKMAHISEYLILTLLIAYGFIKNNYGSLWLLGIVPFIYAISDECHQLFINGRAGQFQDVLIDTIGTVIALFIILFYKKRQLNKHQDI